MPQLLLRGFPDGATRIGPALEHSEKGRGSHVYRRPRQLLLDTGHLVPEAARDVESPAF